jgi:Na+-driven multidrug efflux pump
VSLLIFLAVVVLFVWAVRDIAAVLATPEPARRNIALAFLIVILLIVLFYFVGHGSLTL